MEYKSVVGEIHIEKTIEKSRFLTYVSHIEDEKDAKAFLSKIRALHPLATHVCYAYIADKTGNLQRFSDDGEPQGTAGLPILGVLKAQNLKETAIAVVRYFGGIKLGAGGLTRAYSGGAAECVDAAEKRLYSMGLELTLEVEYSRINALLKFLEGQVILARDFKDKACFTVVVPEIKEKDFIVQAQDFLNGKVKIVSGKHYFYPF